MVSLAAPHAKGKKSNDVIFGTSAAAKADIQKIEAMKVVKGSFTQAGQFQVIIGNTVSDFYKEIL